MKQLRLFFIISVFIGTTICVSLAKLYADATDKLQTTATSASVHTRIYVPHPNSKPENNVFGPPTAPRSAENSLAIPVTLKPIALAEKAVGDPLQLLMQPPGPFKGRLVYAWKFFNQPPLQRYLLVRNLGLRLKNDENRPIAYSVIGSKQYLSVFEPAFSPDGHHILFKMGVPGLRQGKYYIYILDLDSNQVKPLSAGANHNFISPNNLRVLWSPDSKYLAYLEGGDVEGNTEPNEVLSLVIYNLTTGESHVVVKNNAVRFSFEWGSPHTLFYSILPQGSQPVQTTRKLGQAWQTAAHPNTYTFSAETSEAKLIIQNAYRPMPSPDGHQIAFFGSEHPEHPDPLTYDWEYNPQGLALSVANSDGSKRRVLNREYVTYSTLRWTQDSKHLITTKMIKPSPDAKAQVREWDLVTGKWREIGVLEAKDIEPVMRIESQPQFQPLEISKDGAFLFVKVYETTGTNGAYYNGTASIKAMNLKTGETSILARTQNDLGEDWLDESMPPETNTLTQTLKR